MTAQDFIGRVAAFFEKEGLDDLSPQDDEEIQEAYFSHSPCEVCERRLGGMREDWSGYNPTTKEVQGPYAVCEDCMLYIANGDIPEKLS